MTRSPVESNSASMIWFECPVKTLMDSAGTRGASRRLDDRHTREVPSSLSHEKGRARGSGSASADPTGATRTAGTRWTNTTMPVAATPANFVCEDQHCDPGRQLGRGEAHKRQLQPSEVGVSDHRGKNRKGLWHTDPQLYFDLQSKPAALPESWTPCHCAASQLQHGSTCHSPKSDARS
jgi:hypothetical protein